MNNKKAYLLECFSLLSVVILFDHLRIKVPVIVSFRTALLFHEVIRDSCKGKILCTNNKTFHTFHHKLRSCTHDSVKHSTVCTLTTSRLYWTSCHFVEGFPLLHVWYTGDVTTSCLKSCYVLIEFRLTK